jgi:glycerol kinase
MISAPTLLAIDQGTTSSRAIFFTAKGKIVGVKQKELKLLTPENGWVEQNPEDIWNDTLWAIQSLLKEHPEEARNLATIGIANQRETTIVWDRKNGKPIYNAIVWQDRRTAKYCADLKAHDMEKSVSAKTGLLLDPYFSATKIAWILQNVPGARAKAEKGELAFGTVDTFLLWRITGGRVHATDATNASRTMLFNIRDGRWDDVLLKMFNIPRSLLPEVKDNVADFGKTDIQLFGKSYTIGGMAGDQQAALFGQACFTEGMVKSTYGTGCFALMNIGKKFRFSENRLLTTIGYRIEGQNTYAIEGAIFVAGAAIQWLRDGMRLFRNAAETEGIATSVKDSGGVYFVPAFTGLGAPYWVPEARGIISGLTRGTTSAHIVRAALEAQAYQTRDLMKVFIADGGHDPKVIRADGGLVANHFMCQFLADQIGKPVEIPDVAETTAFGVASMAGLQCGVYKGLDDIAAVWRCARRYEPSIVAAQRDTLYTGWTKTIASILPNVK